MAYGYIVQGDNGITIDFTVDRIEVTNLEGATVKMHVKRDSYIFEKPVEVLDVSKKMCRFELTNLDLTITGKYTYQYIVTLADGRIYAGKIESLSVSNRLSGNPNPPTDPPSGSGILVYATLSELQAAYPNGTTQPVWVSGENAWYYWGDVSTTPTDPEPEPTDTTPPILTITPSGTFTDTKQVTMSTNETATIWYTLDDSDPKTSGTKIQYTAPLTLTATDTIKAYAVDSANNQSSVQTVTYTKEEPLPVDGNYHLYFNNNGGVQIPAFNKDRIELEVSVHANKSGGTVNTGYLLDFRSAVQGMNNGYVFDGGVGSGISEYYINGVAGIDKTTHWANIPKDSKVILKYVGVTSSLGTSSLFMRNNQFDQQLRVKFYKARVYSGYTLVASYNLTNQISGTTITDETGNGNHASFTGGVFTLNS